MNAHYTYMLCKIMNKSYNYDKVFLFQLNSANEQHSIFPYVY